ncbi:hypothetical protein [Priestia aryabhattai]|uniref:hypothetical protein n=1 Tax=Priestia aryabhattai TaxID=412384 RepID=UPI003D2C2010
MEDTKENEKTVKININYMVILVVIAFVFSYVSCVALLGKSTDLNDVYVSFCAILGGVVGGLITLEGVKRTILAQREITLEGVKETIEAQRSIEAQKLIPHKLVKLHELTRELKSLGEIRQKCGTWSWEIRNFSPKSNNYVSEVTEENFINCVNYYGEIRELTFHTLDDIEYKFVKIASEIDIDVYKEVKFIFGLLKDEFKNLIDSYTLEKYMLFDDKGEITFPEILFKEYFKKKISKEELLGIVNRYDELGYEWFTKGVGGFTEYLDAIWTSLPQLQEELEDLLNKKLNQYGKEML